MYTIQSDRLRVEIAAPGESPNSFCRFDRAGFVTEIVLDGIHRFAASEPHNLDHLSTGGRGLCDECWAGLDGDVKAGGWFPKLGIGLMQKADDKPYSQYGDYNLKPFHIDITQIDESSIRFETAPMELNGIALWQEKRIVLAGNTLTMHMQVRNDGSKPIKASQYCHNYLSLNGMALGPAYKINLPCIADQGSKPITGVMVGNGRGYTFTGYDPRPMLHAIPIEDLQQGKPFHWSMENKEANAAVYVKDNVRLDDVYVWACDHMVSVEVSHDIYLEPGQSDSWSREYTFTDFKG